VSSSSRQSYLAEGKFNVRSSSGTLVSIGIDHRERDEAMSRFVRVDCDRAYSLPRSVHEWLPQEHLSRYGVEVGEAHVLCPLSISEHARQSCSRNSGSAHARFVSMRTPGNIIARTGFARSNESVRFSRPFLSAGERWPRSLVICKRLRRRMPSRRLRA
jgi:hypothetical protein